MSWCGQWKASWENCNWCFIFKSREDLGASGSNCQSLTQSTHQTFCIQLQLVRRPAQASCCFCGEPYVLWISKGSIGGDWDNTSLKWKELVLVCQYLFLNPVPICLLQSILDTAGTRVFPSGANGIQAFPEVDHTALNLFICTNWSPAFSRRF